MPSISEKQISTVFKRAMRRNELVDSDDSALLFFDLSFLKKRIENLAESFPPPTLHAIAIKANPLVSILKMINKFGVGAEAASLPELFLAQHAGFPANRIVYDSPVKTKNELEYILKSGVHMNADSIEEIERIAELLPQFPNHGPIGIRINPQIGTGKIMTTSVAGTYSKFGVPLNECRQHLLDLYLKYPWLSAVHVHIGSQGCDPRLLAQGIKIIVDFMHEVNHHLSKQNRRINLIDIGGGLPVSYHKDQPCASMSDYVNLLKTYCPALFDDNKIITEFGRHIYANSGWAISRVEYVKSASNSHTAMIHVGADLFLRRCYHPDDWHHDMTVLDSCGDLKPDTPGKKYVIAGPLCFSGDILERDKQLPIIRKGDFVVIHDAGAYTFGMWSRHNSRQMPKVIGYENNGEFFTVLKERETPNDIVEFWS